MVKRKTTAQFIQDARKVHGDKYDYSLVEYVNNHTKVKIRCPDHGVFEQQPNNHLFYGCRECGFERTINTKRKATNYFIEDAQKVHGDKYDYSLTEYVNAKTKVKIVCPVHGMFLQSPDGHVNQGAGCPKCAGRAKTTEEFIKESSTIHNGKYDYSLAKYAGAKAKVKIVCPVHGMFLQEASSHLNGYGCFECGRDRTVDSKRKTTEVFIQHAQLMHGDRYDYSQVEYVNRHAKVKIICPDHGEFWQAPSSHLNCSGCPICGASGFNPGIAGTLYFLRFQKDFATFWKIGITNRTIEKRFGGEALFITDRHEWQFDKGIHAYQIEQKVLKQFQAYKQPPMLFPLLDYGGDSECFTPNLPYKKAIATIEREVNDLV